MEVSIIVALISILPSVLPLIITAVKSIEGATAGAAKAGESKFDFVFSTVWAAIVGIEPKVESNSTLKTFVTNWLTTTINKIVGTFNTAKVGATTMFVHSSATPATEPVAEPEPEIVAET
jgi:hypothetical protein